MAYAAKPPKQTEDTQGIAFIICNSYDNGEKRVKTDLAELLGTKEDMDNWRKALAELKFDCRSDRNLSEKAMEDFIKLSSDITMDQQSSRYVIFVFSGHGNTKYILSQDNVQIPLKKFLKPLFKGTMADKTKLIYIDACRNVPRKDYVPESAIPPGEETCYLFYPTHLGGSTPGGNEAGSTFSREASKLLLKPLTVYEMGRELKKKMDDCKECKSTSGCGRFIPLDGSDEKQSTDWKYLQRPGDSVSQHSLPSTGQPNQGDQLTMQPSTTAVADQRTLALREAHEKLKRFYTKPAKCKPFVNLALVERPSKVDKTKKDVKEFLEATKHGIDRYTGEQKKIEYETILTSTGSDSGKRVLINGSPGSGKTTLARKLCRDLYSGNLPNEYQLVLFTELKAFRSYTNKKNKEASLLTLLEYLGLPEPDSLCSMIKKEEGRGVAIIFDGYDEISDVSCKTLAKWVSEVFCDECLPVSECDVFITTRPSQLSKLAEVASVHLEILGFSSSDIDFYIKDYFKGAPDRAEEVIRRLIGFPLVRGLCSNPRVLEISCKILKHQDEEPPANLSGIFLRYLCYQLEVDLTQRQPPVKTRIKDLLSVSKKLFQGFYPLCSLAYHCCLRQQLMLEDDELGEVINYIIRGSVYNLLFGEVVDSSSEMSCVLYQCDHKTVMEALAAVHIAVLSPVEQQKIWDEWFTAPHMAQVWMMYCGLTGLKFVDLKRLCSLTVSERSGEVAKDLVPTTSYHVTLDNEDKLVMVSLFEAGNDDVAKRVLPHLLKDTIRGIIRSQCDVLCLAYSITHHPHLSRVGLNLFLARMDGQSELDLQPLTTSLKNVKAFEIKCDNIKLLYIVLPRAVEELSLDLDKNYYNYDWLRDALTDCHCLRSLTITHPDFGVWTGLDSVLNSTKPTEFHLKGGEYFGGIPSDESLKTLLVHREKCSLQIMKMSDYHIAVVLSGLKNEDKLKELDLHIGVLTGHEDYYRYYRIVTCAEVEDLVATYPHLVKVDVITYNNKSDLLIAVVKGAIRNKNITHLGLGPHEINAVHPLLCSPSADHITSIRVEHLRHDDAWSEDVIAGSMARQTCHLDLVGFAPASLGLLLSRVNTATKLKDLSLEVDANQSGLVDQDLVDQDLVDAVETAFTNCSLHKLRIKFVDKISNHSRPCHLQTAILNGLAANTTTQVDSCIYGRKLDTKEITRHLSQQALQRFEVVRTGGWYFFISRDPSCPSGHRNLGHRIIQSIIVLFYLLIYCYMLDITYFIY